MRPIRLRTRLPRITLASVLALGLGACSEQTPVAEPVETDPTQLSEDFSATVEEIEKIGEDDPRTTELLDIGVSGTAAADVDRVLALVSAEPHLPAVQIEGLSALEFLGKHVPAEAAAACGSIMDQAEEAVVRARAADALEYIEGREATEILLSHLQDPSPDVRERVADALELMVGVDDLDPVQAAFDAETDRDVKAEIFELIENIELDRRRLEAEAGDSV